LIFSLGSNQVYYIPFSIIFMGSELLAQAASNYFLDIGLENEDYSFMKSILTHY